jgi:hypothetical protein
VPNAVAGRPAAEGDAAQTHVARGARVEAEQNPGEFGSSGAHQPGHAQDFARAELKADGFQEARLSDAGNVQQHPVGRLAGPRRKQLGDFAADHQGDHAFDRQFPRR